MNKPQQELFERRLLSLSRGLEYPRTPDVAGSVMKRLHGSPASYSVRRRLVWPVVVLLVLCASLMLIPPARAAIIEFIQIGAVRIFGTEPTPVPSFPQLPLTATPSPTLQPLIPLLEDVAGEVTLAQAEHLVRYPILLPSYPPDLGQPDRVFVQDAEGKLTILVWTDHRQPDRVRMSLHFIPAGSWEVTKYRPQVMQETRVNGRHAVWAVGPYFLQLSNGDLQETRLVAGNVLIWTDGAVTYRLESDLSMEEAVKVAESLEPIR